MYAARPELGTKRICVSCAVRFFDLGRTPAQCPACHAEQPAPRARTAPLPRGAGTRWSPRPAPAAATAASADDSAPMLDTADDEDDDAEETDEAEGAAEAAADEES